MVKACGLLVAVLVLRVHTISSVTFHPKGSAALRSNRSGGGLALSKFRDNPLNTVHRLTGSTVESPFSSNSTAQLPFWFERGRVSRIASLLHFNKSPTAPRVLFLKAILAMGTELEAPWADINCALALKIGFRLRFCSQNGDDVGLSRGGSYSLPLQRNYVLRLFQQFLVPPSFDQDDEANRLLEAHIGRNNAVRRTSQAIFESQLGSCVRINDLMGSSDWQRRRRAATWLVAHGFTKWGLMPLRCLCPEMRQHIQDSLGLQHND